jgi:hypothetical protein
MPCSKAEGRENVEPGKACEEAHVPQSTISDIEQHNESPGEILYHRSHLHYKPPAHIYSAKQKSVNAIEFSLLRGKGVIV